MDAFRLNHACPVCGKELQSSDLLLEVGDGKGGECFIHVGCKHPPQVIGLSLSCSPSSSEPPDDIYDTERTIYGVTLVEPRTPSACPRCGVEFVKGDRIAW